MSETPDLAVALLEADVSERERLLRQAEPAALESALSELGHRRESAAAEVLSQVDRVVEDRALRKAARRELHRLRSMGVQAPVPPAVVTAQPAATDAHANLDLSQAWATDVDPTGSRALWLLKDRPLGGAWFGAVLVNDLHGLQDVTVVDTTRKRFQRELDQRRGEGAWISLPGEYALRLVREAVDLTREEGGGLPPRYRQFRDAFGEAPGPPERALVYDTIKPVEVNFNPEWLDESARILTEPEVAGWHVPAPPELRTRVLEVARAPAASLVLPGNSPEQQARSLLAEAAHQVFTPGLRRALRRRLEETAFIFATTERLGAARLAVAAARALEDAGTGAGSSLALDRHPLIRLLVAAGLARLIQTESIGDRRAPDVLLELIDRATQNEERGGPMGETRPSGLVLPR